MEEDTYVRSVYEFHSAIEGELPLLVNDVVRIIKRVDKNWFYGSCQGKTGNFPSAFVISLSLPNTSEGQKVFAAIDNFAAIETGDLEFKKGDIIHGLQAIDDNWWKGRCDNQEGMFPLTHVEELHVQPMLIKNCSNVRKSAKVLMDMTAQLEDEIDLFKDDIVYVTEIIDKDWYRGEYNGKIGIFPSAFVKLIEPNECVNEVQPVLGIQTPDKCQEYVEPVLGIQTPDKCQEYVEPVLGIQTPDKYQKHLKNEKVLSSKINLIYPNIESINSNQSIGYDPKKTRSKSFLSEEGSGVLPYGRTLYPFSAQFSNELSFVEGELVKLLRHIDDYWVEGEIDGKIGLFPTSYVDIIVDCAEIIQNDKSELSKRHSCPSSIFSSFDNCPADVYARVLYDYNGETEQDLPLSEGDTITILKKMNSDWFEARHDDGTIGLCPVSYVEIIGCDPFSFQKNVDVDGHKNQLNSIAEVKEFEVFYDTCYDQPKPPPYLPPKPKPPLYKTLDFNSSNYQKDVSFDLDSNIEKNLSSLVGNSIPIEKPINYSPMTLPLNKHKTSNLDKTIYPVIQHRPQVGMIGKSYSLDIKNINELTLSEPQICKKSPTSPTRPPLPPIGKLVPHRPAPPIPVSPRRGYQKTWENGSTDPYGNDDKHIYCYPDLDSLKQEELSRMVGVAASQGITPEEMRNKRQEKRAKIVEELLQTEKDYLRDLQLCSDAFSMESSHGLASSVPSDLDLETLFGYLDEVIDISHKLWTSLSDTVYQKSWDEPVIGPCFVNIADDMKEVYGHYCRNHDDVIALLEKYEDNKEIQIYFNERLEYIRQHSNCFDLGSLLIKPVQRILKYPLLLNELLKSTEDTSLDKQHLLNAINAMTDVATAINEFKRRKDLVFKYRKETDSSFTNKIAKLNLHSMKKKSSRIRARLSSTFGTSSVARDEQFTEEEKKFKSLEKIMKGFLRNVNCYVEQLKGAVSTKLRVAEDIADYYAEKNLNEEVIKYQSAQRYINTALWPYFKNFMESRVQVPLNRVLILFHGPNKVIDKRHDKLLDYDSWKQKLEKTKDTAKHKMLNDERELAKKNYEALNAQLLDELPKFYKVALEVFHGCMTEFLQGQKWFASNVLCQLHPLLQLPLLSCKSRPLDNFNVKHNLVVDKMSELTVIPRNFNPNKSDKIDKERSDKKFKRLSLQLPSTPKLARSTPSVPNTQSDSQRAFIRASYPNKVYIVTQSYSPLDVMDLAVSEGDIIGLLKGQDPMGNSERWFIDNGTMKGFVPRQILAPMCPISGENTAPLLQFDEPFQPVSSKASIAAANPHPPPPVSHDYDYLPEFHIAIFQFSATGPYELSLNVNQSVLVLQQQDLEGNPEWWLVEDDEGNKGYVPANYLAKWTG